ncbi:hypothetical protein C8R43DRAFT_1229196 [Mycena crocata]|nr:hypothetical protein C8R43DRAFT_1229196 [Mycena crocata]
MDDIKQPHVTNGVGVDQETQATKSAEWEPTQQRGEQPSEEGVDIVKMPGDIEVGATPAPTDPTDSEKQHGSKKGPMLYRIDAGNWALQVEKLKQLTDRLKKGEKVHPDKFKFLVLGVAHLILVPLRDLFLQAAEKSTNVAIFGGGWAQVLGPKTSYHLKVEENQSSSAKGGSTNASDIVHADREARRSFVEQLITSSGADFRLTMIISESLSTTLVGLHTTRLVIADDQYEGFLSNFGLSGPTSEENTAQWNVILPSLRLNQLTTLQIYRAVAKSVFRQFLDKHGRLKALILGENTRELLHGIRLGELAPDLEMLVIEFDVEDIDIPEMLGCLKNLKLLEFNGQKKPNKSMEEIKKDIGVVKLSEALLSDGCSKDMVKLVERDTVNKVERPELKCEPVFRGHTEGGDLKEIPKLGEEESGKEFEAHEQKAYAAYPVSQTRKCRPEADLKMSEVDLEGSGINGRFRLRRLGRKVWFRVQSFTLCR